MLDGFPQCITEFFCPVVNRGIFIIAISYTPLVPLVLWEKLPIDGSLELGAFKVFPSEEL
jgi:hypothetical protein